MYKVGKSNAPEFHFHTVDWREVSEQCGARNIITSWLTILHTPRGGSVTVNLEEPVSGQVPAPENT